jgi:hypothetical protein
MENTCLLAIRRPSPGSFLATLSRKREREAAKTLSKKDLKLITAPSAT